MKIVICGGTTQASYIIEMFKKDKKKHKIVVINDSQAEATRISEKFNIEVIVGDFTKSYTLTDAQIEDSDLFIALGDIDADNYVACMLAKNVYRCKKTISTVTNPSNVNVFKHLGVDTALSSSYLIGETIKNESNVEDVCKSLTIDNDLIKIIEVVVKSNYSICDKEIKDISWPEYATISAILRGHHIIIPKGKTIIQAGDKLIAIVATASQEGFVKFIDKLKVAE